MMRCDFFEYEPGSDETERAEWLQGLHRGTKEATK